MDIAISRFETNGAVIHKIGDVMFFIDDGSIYRITPTGLVEQVLSPDELQHGETLYTLSIAIAQIEKFVSMVYCKDTGDIAILSIGRNDQYYIVSVDLMFVVVGKPKAMFTAVDLDSYTIIPGSIILRSHAMEKTYSIASTGYANVTEAIDSMSCRLYTSTTSRVLGCLAIGSDVKVVTEKNGVFYIVNKDVTEFGSGELHTSHASHASDESIILIYRC